LSHVLFCFSPLPSGIAGATFEESGLEGVAMLNLAIVVSVVLFSPAATLQADVPALRQSILREVEAGRAYAELRSMKVRERSPALQQMPPAMQSAVWAHHFLTMLAEHPEFTPEQRAVIQEALALTTPELFAIDSASPQWSQLVHEPLARLTERARKVFPPRIARELFTQLGPEARQASIMERYTASRSAGKRTPGNPRLRQLGDFPPCECSVTSDWCDFSGFDYLECRNVWCNYSPTGCGTLLRHACEGMCRRR
jgi:hypothetical protein